MAAIKGKERVMQKPLLARNAKLSAQAKKKLKRPQDVQPIPTVCVS
jgi:hypothetical protein